MPSVADHKLFCIGFHKTGTTSLTSALRCLGYTITGPNGVDNPNIGQEVYDMVDSLVPQYDAFQDNPWPIVYRYLDAKYAKSKFILTIRETEDWLISIVRHFGTSETPMRKWIYGVGSPVGNEEIYRARYQRHNEEVLDYFRDRPADLLVLQVTEGEGWEKLCPFLGRTIPEEPFPHLNRAGNKRKAKSLLNKARLRVKRAP